MRWREKGDFHGDPPPATESMVRTGTAFSLEYKALRSGVNLDQWAYHKEVMKKTYVYDDLKKFCLDYMTLEEFLDESKYVAPHEEDDD